jgi:hypothetical protein
VMAYMVSGHQGDQKIWEKIAQFFKKWPKQSPRQ